MNPDTVLDIVTAPQRDSRHWKESVTTWGEILSWAQTPGKVKAAGNYVLGKLMPTTVDHDDKKRCTALHRRKGAVVSRSAITLDVDHPDSSLVDAIRAAGNAALIHTTFSSSPEAPRYRVIVAADRNMAPDEYHAAAEALMQRYGHPAQFDPGSVQPERYMFRPAASKPEWFESWVVDGPPVAVDELLSEFDPESTSVPLPKPNRTKRDPFEMDGPVGAFNRVYSIEEAIEEFALPYEPGEGGRWHLVGAASVAGMGQVTDGLVYSHHVSDPAYGQTCSAFDLVRLHYYSDLDEGVSDKTPVNRRPSHKAMVDMVSTDARVVAEMVGLDFATEMDGEHGWRINLRLSSTGKVVDCIENWDLFREHEPVFAGLYFNELTLAVETDRDLPWRSRDDGGVTFADTDRIEFAHHIEREYRFSVGQPKLDGHVDTVARRRRVNPIRDYLVSLSWDGTPRVEECLPGVRPTEYTRLVARKSIVAAVARIMQPGIKWDHSLVLFGSEGLGKSYWVERMSRGYSASMGRIGDKDTLITMQRSWIMVSDEGHSLRKADADVQKEFLTRTEDVFRMPYDRESRAHKRHCVIWGTTNDGVFLRRQEGNRRFLIVKCTERVDFEKLTDEYVDQVWAEAMHLFRAGERLFLGDSEASLAALEREHFTEADSLLGLIEEYVETPVPDDWKSLTPSDRRQWMADRSAGLVAAGSHLMDRVCARQIAEEVLGQQRRDTKLVDLREITESLKRLPGWKMLPGRARVHGYGRQQAFQRDDTELL